MDHRRMHGGREQPRNMGNRRSFAAGSSGQFASLCLFVRSRRCRSHLLCSFSLLKFAHETHEMTRKEEEKTELIYKEESYAIVGACMAVYKDKGCGFLEPVYHECLAIEFEFRGIPFLSKPPQTLQYRERTLVQTFSPDFICYEKIIVEIKAVSALGDEHRAQVLNYLSATGCKLGLLVNFGHYPKLQYGRLLPRHQEPVN